MTTMKQGKTIKCVYKTTDNVYEIEHYSPVLIKLKKNGICVGIVGCTKLFSLVQDDDERCDKSATEK